MQNVLSLLLLSIIALAAGLTSSETTYVRPDLVETQRIEIPEVKSPYNSILSVPEGVKPPMPPPDPIECSCVRTAQEIYPELPLWDAIEFKGNGNVDNSELVILQYKSKKSDGYVYHIAPYKKATSTLHIYNEGNFEECKRTERDIAIDSENIIGYFDYDLWLKIKELPETAYKTMLCESHFQHYESDGSIMFGLDYDYGIGQFTRKTWNWFNELRVKQGLPHLYEIFDPYQQVEMMEFAWKNNLQKHWVCFNRIYPPEI